MKIEVTSPSPEVAKAVCQHLNASLDKSHPLRDMIQVQPEEVQPFDGWEGCWAGDGSGMDDFADWNAQEGCDS